MAAIFEYRENPDGSPLSTPLRITNDTIARVIGNQELQTRGRAIQPEAQTPEAPGSQLLAVHYVSRAR